MIDRRLSLGLVDQKEFTLHGSNHADGISWRRRRRRTHRRRRHLHRRRGSHRPRHGLERASLMDGWRAVAMRAQPTSVRPSARTESTRRSRWASWYDSTVFAQVFVLGMQNQMEFASRHGHLLLEQKVPI